MKLLLVGDIHATVDSLDDCSRLDDLIQEVQFKERPDAVVYLGDQYDNFALKNTEVEHWWMEALSRRVIGAYLLLGNHDRPQDQAAHSHALQSHRHQTGVAVIESHGCLDKILLLPFFFKAEDFVAACKEHSDCNTIICHQSFIGGKCENGMPIEERHDPSAVDPAAVPQRCIISGHIHTPMTFGKVWYPGSPRWRNNLSDANVDRAIHVVEFSEQGLPVGARPYSTGDVCRRTWYIQDNPGRLVEKPGKEGDRYRVDVTGPAAYVEERRVFWAGPGVRVRTFPTDQVSVKLSEAEGIPAAWKTWAGVYKPKFGTSPAVLAAMARERLML